MLPTKYLLLLGSESEFIRSTMVLEATQSLRLADTMFVQTGFAFAGDAIYGKAALSAADVNTPELIALVILAPGFNAGTSATVMAIFTFKLFANSFHFAALPPYNTSAEPKLPAFTSKSLIAASK